jgi:hypothetical protein
MSCRLLIVCLIGVGCGNRMATPAGVAEGDACAADPLAGPPPANCAHDLPTADDCQIAAPSYDVDIMPILETRCRECHSPNAIAARIVFDTYDRAYGSYKLMYTQIFSCQMPPSCAGELPDEERRTLLKWFVCKAPPGPTQRSDGGAADGTGS